MTTENPTSAPTNPAEPSEPELNAPAADEAAAQARSGEHATTESSAPSATTDSPSEQPTNAADRWYPELHAVHALYRLATGVMATHAETQLGACSMDEEVNDAWYAMREAQEKLQRVIDELMSEGSRYTLEVLAEVKCLNDMPKGGVE